MPEAAQAPLIAGFAARADKRIDTQGAVVFLMGGEAIKIRRAVKLPFLDYSTLEKRRQAAQAEIAINRPYAPHIYKDAAPIRRTRDGFGFEGDGEIVEWATRMRAFDADATLDRIAARGELTDALIAKLAGALHAMHAHAPPRAAEPTLASMRGWIEQNAESFAARPDLFPPQPARDLTQASVAALAKAAPSIRERGARGFVRRCHGDLHLRNIALIDGAPTPFDGIEFDDAIATGDVLYDLAFALMDLWERDLRRQANLLFNLYLGADFDAHADALAALPLYLSLRAAIRAKVEANGAAHLPANKRAEAEAAARRYFDFAGRFLHPAAARLVALGGLSGTGKSVLAAALAPDIGAAPGAVLLRSDVERKAMAGVAATTRLGEAAYAGPAKARVYARLNDKARRLLDAGASVVLDATFAHAAERASAAALGGDFDGLFLEAPLATRLARVSQRRGDASDADAEVARAQQADPLREKGWRALDASGDPAATRDAARVALGLSAVI